MPIPLCDLQKVPCIIKVDRLNWNSDTRMVTPNNQIDDLASLTADTRMVTSNNRQIDVPESVTAESVTRSASCIPKKQNEMKRRMSKRNKVNKVKEESDEDIVFEELNKTKNESNEENMKFKDNGMSAYEQMVMKNREAKMELLEMLKINEVKTELVETVQKMKSIPQKKRPIKRPKEPSSPVVLRKSLRLAKVNVDFSEDSLFEKHITEQEKLVQKMELPAVLPFEKAMNCKEEYSNYFDYVSFHCDTDVHLKPLQYARDIIQSLKTDISTIAKVTPGRITAMTLHPSCDKIIVCAGSKYGDIGIWNVVSDCDPYVFRPHYEGITCLQFNPFNFNQFLSSSYDGTVRIGDIEMNVFNEVYNVSGETSCTYFDILSSNTYLVAQKNGKVSLVDNRVDGKQSAKGHRCHEYSVKTVNVHPLNKSFFITAENKGPIRLWDLRKLQAEPIAHVSHHKRCVQSAYFSPVTGNYVLTTSADDSVGVFDSSVLSNDIKLIKSLKHNNFTGRWLSVFRATWLPGSDDLFVIGSMSYPRRIEIFNRQASSVCNIVNDELNTVTSLNVFHPFKPVLAAGNSSGKVYVFMETLSD